jgi:hypothetical protein
MSTIRKQPPILKDCSQIKFSDKYNSKFWEFEEDRCDFDEEVDEITESYSPLKECVLYSHASEKMSSSCMSNTGKLPIEKWKLIMQEDLFKISKEERSNSYNLENDVEIVEKSEQKVSTKI